MLWKIVWESRTKKAYFELGREGASWILLHHFYLWDSLDLSLQGHALLYHSCARMKLAEISWHWIKCKKGLEQEIKSVL